MAQAVREIILSMRNGAGEATLYHISSSLTIASSQVEPSHLSLPPLVGDLLLPNSTRFTIADLPLLQTVRDGTSTTRATYYMDSAGALTDDSQPTSVQHAAPSPPRGSAAQCLYDRDAYTKMLDSCWRDKPSDRHELMERGVVRYLDSASASAARAPRGRTCSGAG